MKKVLAALLVASFGAGLMAQNVVYDYKASIKRLDAQFSVKSAKSGKFVAQSYKVASDTLAGYIVLPLCEGCNGPATSLATTFATQAGPSKAYIIRKGDKLSKASKIYSVANKKDTATPVPYVLVADVDGAAALFGAYNVLPNDAAPHTSIVAANKAWMSLDYALPNNATTISSKKVIAQLAEEGMSLGFLGLTNVGVNRARALVQHTGFGTAKITSWSEAAKLGWCSSEPGSSGSCQIVNAITGTLVGYPRYLGMCLITPMWDVCYGSLKSAAVIDATTGEVVTPAVYNEDTVEDGVICGTWSIKYNAGVSAAYNAKTTAAAKEEYLIGKLGAKVAVKIDQNYPVVP